jgi:hypothetical protein
VLALAMRHDVAVTAPLVVCNRPKASLVSTTVGRGIDSRCCSVCERAPLQPAVAADANYRNKRDDIMGIIFHHTTRADFVPPFCENSLQSALV